MSPLVVPNHKNKLKSLLLLLLFALMVSPAVQADDHKKKEKAKKKEAPKSYVLKAGRLYTGTGELLEPAVVIVKDGKITAIGKKLDLPKDLPVLDYSTQTILPGFIAFNLPLAGRNSDARSLSPEYLALDAYDIFREYNSLLRAGITSAGISTRSNRLLSGRGLVVKTGGAKGEEHKRIVRAAGGFEVQLGEPSKRPPSVYNPPVLASPDDPFKVLPIQPPVSRAGALHALSELMAMAKAYDAKRKEKGSKTSFEPGLEALRDLVSGKDYLKVQADRAIDIVALADLAHKNKVSVAFEGAREAYRLRELLAQRKIPVVLTGTFEPGKLSREDLSQTTIYGASQDGIVGTLLKAGVKVGLQTPSDSPDLLLFQALDAVRLGISTQDALKTITSTPAEILGVQDRVGSLQKGKDADFVVFEEDPFKTGGSPVATFVSGKMVYPLLKDQPEDITLIRCGIVYPVSSAPIHGGVIALKDGKIHAVGNAAVLGMFPNAKKVIDATDQVVIPGMIDAVSQLGVHSERIFPTTSRNHPSGGGGRATYRLYDALDPKDPDLQVVGNVGFTTVLLTPDPVGSFSGQITAIKIRGKDQDPKVVKDPVAFLMGSVSTSTLKSAQKYHETWVKYEKALEDHKKKLEKEAKEKKEKEKAQAEKGKEGKKPTPKPAAKAPTEPTRSKDMDVLRAIFTGKLPVLVNARSESYFKNIFVGLTDKVKTKVTIMGPSGLSSASRDELRRRKIGFLMHPSSIQNKASFPQQLDSNGIPFGIVSGTSVGARDLPFQIAYAVREGLSEKAALEAVTLAPARFFGLDKNIGSIEDKKDADLVFLSGRPFGLTTQVLRVMVDGKFVYQKEK